MSTQYRLDLHNAAGAKVAELTDFWSLSYTRRVNAPGRLDFSLAGDHRAVADLEHNGEVIVYRRNPALGLDWTADFWGLFRGMRRRFSDHDRIEAVCPGLLTMLGRRIVAWKAGTSNRSSFSSAKAETVMKTLVSYNAGASATTGNGRIRNGTINGISVQADGAGGNTLSVDCAWDNLLEILQKVAAIGGGDFDLIKTGAASWEFQWFSGQRGTDRTATLLFALERGNMAEPEYSYDRTEERTVAVVGGQGEGADRAVVVRTGPDYAAGNDIETFVDARNNTTTEGLNASGDAKLAASRALQQFDYRVVQTPGCAYGVHYGLGDLVKAQYGPVLVTQKIVGVSVGLDRDGNERIDVEMQTA